MITTIEQEVLTEEELVRQGFTKIDGVLTYMALETPEGFIAYIQNEEGKYVLHGQCQYQKNDAPQNNMLL